MKITENILIGELIDKYPKIAEKLVKKYGFHCIGCMAAGGETLGEGARVHGMSEKEIKKMIREINLEEEVEDKVGDGSHDKVE